MIATALFVLAQIPSPFTVQELTPGLGPEAKAGDRVTVEFVATTDKGKVVADSERRGLPLTFEVGKTAAEPIWDWVVPGMKVGGQRRLEVASHWVTGEAPVTKNVDSEPKIRIMVRLVRILPGSSVRR